MIAFDCMGKFAFIMRILTKLVYYVRIIIPIILIVMIIVDLVKVVIGSADEKTKKEATNKAGKRIIYAVLVFLIPTIVSFIFTSLDKHMTSDNNGTPTDWISCWNYYYNK